MVYLLRYRRAGICLKVSALAALLLISACERPTSRSSAPEKPAAERTPKTRANAGAPAVTTAPKVPPDANGVVLSIATTEHVLDCRSGEYHPVMQSALAATGAALRCFADGGGLALQVHSPRDGPAFAVGTLRVIDGGVELRWSGTDRVMVCSPSKSFKALQDVACQGDDIPVIGAAIRRTWP